MKMVPIICQLSAGLEHDLAQIESECNTPPWSVKLFGDELCNRYAKIFGAKQAGTLIGFLVVHEVLEQAHIVNFGVSRAERGKGVGRELLYYVLRDLLSRGVEKVTLEVRRSNAAAIALYENCGFVPVGTRSRYYSDNGEDALTLLLHLQDFAQRFGPDQYAA